MTPPQRSAFMVLVCIGAMFASACSHSSGEVRVPVAGGDAGGMPRDLPADEHLDASALARVTDDAVAAGAQALVVVRHGHLVFEHYGHGVDADTMLAPAGFAAVLPVLAAGIAAQDGVSGLDTRSDLEPGNIRQRLEANSHHGYADYLSVHLWRRLNAADAWIVSAPGQAIPVDCCFHARVSDWLRVGDLLVQDGRFEGKQIVPAGWIGRLRMPVVADGTRGSGVLLPPAVRGGEGFDERDVFFLRGEDRWRMWLFPRLRLVVLFGAVDRGGVAGNGTPWDETHLVNLVTRAISDPASATDAGSKLRGLVPGH
ncbi:MAG TPA: hypothetical protein VHZ99_13780 [Steroidobacteraceae bacterium]|jgi:hypothetical protein|nr:hypothetical protein [Steroidobacteraceae bacterium]